MNLSPTKMAPPIAATNDSANPQLFVILSVPAIPECRLLLPDNNYIACGILSELLGAKLEAAGQLLSLDGFSGPLNSSLAAMTVRDAAESANIICRLLEKNHLITFAEIYCFDERELIFRRIFPTGCKAVWVEDFRRISLAHGAGLEAMRDKIISLVKPPPLANSENPS